ncbi:unnamed protein product [Phytophthora lilii]|uniref:Unnamed protein product n=1 Tax=Phytophthora lilii TaxID=2077276 RepID=A0A9W6TCM3_9STRA|nr:unnamed protein product [Phytophthora lilii]
MLRSHRNGKAHSDNLQSALQRETEFWVKLQRDWQAAKKLFQAQHQRLGALDELAMACSQLRLRQPGEPIGRTKAERLYKLEAAVVPIRAEELEVDRQAADLDLRDCTSQLRYLLQLFGETATRQPPPEELRDVNSSSLSTRPVCAVCLQEFTQKRAVLPCAHSFCTACISTLAGAQQHTRKSVSCPSCRRVCTVGSITEVVEASETDSENQAQSKGISDVPQQLAHRTGGGLGSKLDALLMRVNMLRQDNPSVKCLLFSQWSQMLELAVQALPRIGVRCYMYGTKRQLPQLLSQFQTCPAACVLALPFKVGANGLNIVEATEVLLIEPFLSSSIEAQAVNRVHRLGQTQRTRVHRFIVQNTVEERIYRLTHKQKNESTTLEQNVNSESDEDEGLQRLGVAPGRKEQEKLTMQDLQTLLQGEMQGNATAVQQSAAVDPFWEELVKLNGKCVNRHEACEFLERRHATEVRGDSQNLHSQEPHTRLVDKLVSLLVARELLDLPYQSEDSGAVPERLDPQILQHHRERIYAEIRVMEGDHASSKVKR